MKRKLPKKITEAIKLIAQAGYETEAIRELSESVSEKNKKLQRKNLALRRRLC